MGRKSLKIDPTATPLEGVLAEIAQVVGGDATIALLNERGGTKIYLPAPSHLDGHWLVRLVGRQAAEKLCQYFAFTPDERNRAGRPKHHGVAVVLPSGRALVRTMSRATIRDMTKAGASAHTIARHVRITERSVVRIRATLRVAGEIA